MFGKARYLSLMFIVLAALTPSTGRGEFDEHTVALWLFNEGKGDTIADKSGNGHDGKITGSLKWVKTPFGSGLEFPGDASGYVVVESTDRLKLERLTIEARVKVKKPTGKWQGIICKQRSGCTNRNYGIWVHQSNGTLHAEIGFGGGCDFSLDGRTAITDDNWHYLAFTYDGKSARVYVDGELEGEKPYNKTPFQSDDPITIGVPNLNNPNGLLGVIDEARISNVARSEDEIKEAMEKGLALLLDVPSADRLPIIWGRLKLIP